MSYYYGDAKIEETNLEFMDAMKNVPDRHGVLQVGNKVYIGAMAVAASKIYCVEYDVDQEKITKKVELPYTPPQADVHWCPVIWQDKDGYFWAFTGRYGYAVRVLRSNAPNNIDNWTLKTASITSNGSYIYPFQNADTGRVYVFIACFVRNKWAIYYTDNNGDSWTFQNDTIFPGPITNLYYAVAVYDADIKRLHVASVGAAVVFTQHTNVYYAYSDDFGATWKNAAGTTITEPELVYSGYTTRVSPNLDFTTSPKRLLILMTYGFRTTTWSASDYEARFFYWDGATWQNKLIVNGNTLFVHGWVNARAILKESGGRVHCWIREQDTNVLTNSSKLRYRHFYADPPYTSWVNYVMSIWHKKTANGSGSHGFPITNYWNQLPKGFIYSDNAYSPQHIRVTKVFGFDDIDYWDGTWIIDAPQHNKIRKIMHSPTEGHTHDGINSAKIAGALAYEDMLLIDIIRLPVPENEDVSQTSWANEGGEFRVSSAESYKLTSGTIVWKLAAMIKHLTAGKTIYVRLYNMTDSIEVYGSTISKVGLPYLWKSSLDIGLIDTKSYCVQAYQDDSTPTNGKIWEIFLLVYAKF